MSVLQKAKIIIPSSSSSVRSLHLHCFGFKKKKLFCLGLERMMKLDCERRCPFASNTDNRRTEGWPLSPTPSSCGARVWIRQPAVTADHGSRLPENFSRRSRFIGDFFQVRPMPGVRWRIALRRALCALGDGGSAVAGRGDMTDHRRSARRKGRREDTRPLFDQSCSLEIKSEHCGSISFPPIFVRIPKVSLCSTTLRNHVQAYGAQILAEITGTLKPDFDLSICSMQNPSPQPLLSRPFVLTLWYFGVVGGSVCRARLDTDRYGRGEAFKVFLDVAASIWWFG